MNIRETIGLTIWGAVRDTIDDAARHAIDNAIYEDVWSVIRDVVRYATIQHINRNITRIGNWNEY